MCSSWNESTTVSAAGPFTAGVLINDQHRLDKIKNVYSKGFSNKPSEHCVQK